MNAHQRQEITEIARKLDSVSLPSLATRLRAIVDYADDAERLFPVQDRSGQLVAIPWGLAELLYPAYGNHGQDLEMLATRGGFGRNELGMLAADCYSGSPDKPRPRLRRMPLLDLWEANHA